MDKDAEIYSLRELVYDIINTLTDRDPSITTWIKERMAEIDNQIEP